MDWKSGLTFRFQLEVPMNCRNLVSILLANLTPPKNSKLDKTSCSNSRISILWIPTNEGSKFKLNVVESSKS